MMEKSLFPVFSHIHSPVLIVEDGVVVWAQDTFVNRIFPRLQLFEIRGLSLIINI